MSIHRLIIELQGRDKASDEFRRVQGEADKMARSFASLEGILGVAGVAGFGYLARQAADATWEMGKAGAEALRTEQSFDRLAGRIDETGDALLQSLAKAAHGTVDDMTLMQTTAGLLASGIQTSTEEMVLAMEIAQLKAQQFGLTTAEAYDRMLTGARKFSVEMLDELGINLRAESVYRRKADALGVAVDALTDAQKAESLWQAILEDGRYEIEQYGGAVDDLSTDIERAEAAMKNAKTAVDQFFAPAIADVGEAIAEILPDLVFAIHGLSILANAGIEWAEAAMRGEDAARAFRDTVIEMHGTQKQAAQAHLETAEAQLEAARAARDEADAMVLAELRAEKFSAVEYNAARAAQEAAQARVTAAVEAYNLAKAEMEAAEASEAQAEAMEEAGEAADDLADSLLRLPPAMQASVSAAMELVGELQAFAGIAQAIQGTLEDLVGVSVEEVGKGFETAATRIESGLARLAGEGSLEMLRGLRTQYIAELTKLYAEAGDLTEFELAYREQLIMAAFDDELATLQGAAEEQDDILGDMADSYRTHMEDIRSAIQAALSPTGVTALDMGLAGLGAYEEKWDENARRLDAIAARGFGELEAHPDWAEALKIPPEVLAAGEEALKSWAQQTSDAVRNLTRPDLLNIDAAVAAVEQYFRDQAAKELSLDLITEAVVAKGLVSGDDAKAQVAEALGLEVPALELGITLDSESLEGLSAEGETAVGYIMAGYQTGLESASPASAFGQRFIDDIQANQGVLTMAGKEAWKPIWSAISEAIAKTPFVYEIAAAVADPVVRILQERGIF